MLPLVNFIQNEDIYVLVLPLDGYVLKKDIVVQYFDPITNLQFYFFMIFDT